MLGYAERLRRTYEARKEQDGLNQVQLSVATGLSQSVISEAMDEDHPKIGITASVIARICMAMDVTTDFVLLGIGDEIPRLAKRSAAAPSPGGVELREDVAPTAPPPVPTEPPATPEQKEAKPAGRSAASP